MSLATILERLQAAAPATLSQVRLDESLCSDEEYRVLVTDAIAEAGLSIESDWVEFDYWRAYVDVDGTRWLLMMVAETGDDAPAGWYLLPRLPDAPRVDEAGNEFDYDTLTLDPAHHLGLPVASEPVAVAAAVLGRLAPGQEPSV